MSRRAFFSGLQRLERTYAQEALGLRKFHKNLVHFTQGTTVLLRRVLVPIETMSNVSRTTRSNQDHATRLDLTSTA